MATTVTSTIKSAAGDYTSLSAWEAAKQGNLVSLDQIQVASVYAFEDTTALTINGSTTDATRYLEIIAAAGERHSGYLDTSKARMKVGGTFCILIQDNYVKLRYLQLISNNDDNSLTGIVCDPVNNDIIIDSCIITRQTRTFTYGNNCYAVSLGTDVGGNRYVVNTQVVDWDFGAAKTGNKGFQQINGSGAASYLYNCLAHVPNGHGFSDGYSDVIVKNCLAYGCTDGFNGSFNAASNYNASDLSSDAPGANSRNSQTFTFNNAGIFDFHLTSGDAGAKGYGTDLSGDGTYPFSHDADGETRSSPWSIGPDNGPASAGTIFNKSRFVQQAIRRASYR